MKVYGLTGGIASGKSTVAAILRKANIPVVDADELAREAVKKGSPILEQLARIFGNIIIAHDGSLDRKKLGAIVFADPTKRKQLEAILHPEIKRLASEHIKILEAQGHEQAVYMAPLIFEANLQKDFVKTIVVIAHRERVLERASLRDQSTPTEVMQRLDAQLDNATKINLADAVIENNGTLEELTENVTKIWKKITGLELVHNRTTQKL